jgi:hypothetical protein
MKREDVKNTIGILSMLHEPVGLSSATRLFRDEPVLNWTLRRLSASSELEKAIVICWEDQAEAVKTAGVSSADISVRGPRRIVPEMEMVSAARRWADGWRGGLMGTCEFDRGFFGPWVSEIAAAHDAEGVVLVDPAAGLVDPQLIDDLLNHARTRPDVELCFSQAAPGLSGVLIRAPLLQRLATVKGHPGTLLVYRPDSARRDPIADPACASVPIPLARTSRRFTLDSRRQITRIAQATAHLNGQLASIDGMGLLSAVDQCDDADALPREVVVELNTERATDPIYWPGKRLAIQREPMKLETLKRLLEELREWDDIRLVFGGVGDPLLHENVIQFIAAARSAGISAIAIETDFVGVPESRVTALAESAVDIVSVYLPAANVATYRAVMNVDAMAEAMNNMRLFLQRRQTRGNGVPLLVPTFVKCRQNQAEMEGWYDHWLRTIHCAVVTGPSDFSGLIEDVSPAEMGGPRRRPCASLWRRLMVLSDGRVVSCEQDVTARQVMGTTLAEAQKNAAAMRRDHLAGQWLKHPACAACKQWHRG